MNIEDTLADRGKKYGQFVSHGFITQRLKNVMHETGGWTNLQGDQREALEMIQHKIGRILNGDPNYIDSWIDIEGYAHLVSERLKNDEARVEAETRTGIGARQAQDARASRIYDAQINQDPDDVSYRIAK
jgi:hypothetical protein